LPSEALASDSEQLSSEMAKSDDDQLPADGSDDDVPTTRYYPAECPMQHGYEDWEDPDVDPAELPKQIPACSAQSWDRCGKCTSYVSRDDCVAKLQHHLHAGIHWCRMELAQAIAESCEIEEAAVDPEQHKQWQKNCGTAVKKRKRNDGQGAAPSKGSKGMGKINREARIAEDAARRVVAELTAAGVPTTHGPSMTEAVVEDGAEEATLTRPIIGLVPGGALAVRPSSHVQLRAPVEQGVVVLNRSTLRACIDELGRGIQCMKAGKEMARKAEAAFSREEANLESCRAFLQQRMTDP